MLDWAALNTVSIACSHGDFLPERSRRHYYAAAAVAEEDVSAVGFGEPRRALVEFFCVHGGLSRAQHVVGNDYQSLFHPIVAGHQAGQTP